MGWIAAGTTNRGRRRLGHALLVLALSILFGGLPSAAAAHAEPPVVVLPSGCFLLDGNGQYVSGPRSRNQVMVERGDDGLVTARCTARLMPATHGGVQQWDFATTGRPCTLSTGNTLIQTEDWEEEISADGEAVLTCRATPR